MPHHETKRLEAGRSKFNGPARWVADAAEREREFRREHSAALRQAGEPVNAELAALRVLREPPHPRTIEDIRAAIYAAGERARRAL